MEVPSSTSETAALLTQNKSDTPTVVPIRSEALVGLRGLASLHVLLFHVLLLSPLGINSLGSIEMPLFFLLSGYSLALGYGRTTYDGYTSCLCTNTTQPNGDQRLLFKSWNFYRNRFARVMPMYYFANFIISLPLIYFGHWYINFQDDNVVYKFISAIIDSIAPIGMILPDLLKPFVYAGWTVSTLWFFYLLFPVVLVKFQKYTNEDALRWTVILFWIQLFVGIILFVALKNLPWPFFTAHRVSAHWGLSRLPVFLIGVHAGLLRLRRYNNPNIRHGSNALNFIYAWFPWDFRCPSQEELEQQDELATQRTWAALVTTTSTSHVALIITFGIASSLVNNARFFSMANWAIQLISVHSVLMVIDGLTRDDGLSLLSKICKHKLTQELGRISMTLYLIQGPLISWLGVAAKGMLHSKTVAFDYSSISDEPELMPVWGIPVIVISCPVFAWVLTKCVEEPIRELIRVPN